MTDPREKEEERFLESGPDKDLGFDLFGRLRLQNRQLRDELLDLHRRHVELMRAHIELLEQQTQKRERRPLGDDERERIIALARDGTAIKDIADRTGRKRGTVGRVIHNARQAGKLPWPEKE